MVPRDNRYSVKLDGVEQLQTADDLYKYGLEILGNMSELAKYNALGGIDVQKTAEGAFNRLEESLLFGKGEAALELAKQHGGVLPGVEKNDHKRAMFISVAAKLGNKDGKKLLEQEKKIDPTIYKKVALEAEKWAMIIQGNVAKYPDKNPEITNKMIVTAKKRLGDALGSNKVTAKMLLTHQPVAKINISASPPPTPKTPQKSKKTASCAIM